MSDIVNKLKDKLHISSPADSTASGSNATHEGLKKSFKLAVENSGTKSVDESSLALAKPGSKAHTAWFAHFFDPETVDKLFTYDHMGNFVVIDRKTGAQAFEAMPIYARIGMHILFRGKAERTVVQSKEIEKLLKEQSEKQGKIYDKEDPKFVIPHVESFIKTYDINTHELLLPDLRSYKSLNAFFSRKLKPEARPITAPEDDTVIISAADCRLTVWPTWDAARTVWVKGKNFTLENLLDDKELAKSFGAASLAIFRLAPQDYHRFHAPFDATVGTVKDIPGQYYTVNPQAVNEELDVFTANKRAVLVLDAKLGKSETTVPVAFVAVGALLVASITFTKEKGQQIKKGEDLGFFQYGGSTVIAVFPEGKIDFDADLVKYSASGVETLIKVGEKIASVKA